MTSNTQLPRRLLGIWAHPDDEAYLSAGLMGRVVDAGGHVTSVAVTLGELGFPDDEPCTFDERAAHRFGELTRALGTVGVKDVRSLLLLALNFVALDRVDGAAAGHRPFGEPAG